MSKPSLPSVSEQILRFKGLLEGRHLPLTDPVFGAVVKFVRSGVRIAEADKVMLTSLLCQTFKMDEEQLLHMLSNSSHDTATAGALHTARREAAKATALAREADLLAILPPGWFRNYVDYASNSEVPLAYHVFCALLVAGAAFGRRTWFDMGYFRIFPPIGVILLGPSGIKKTTSSDIAISILSKTKMATIYSEKITPEALAMAMMENAQGVIYAPEAVVLMGKQKYNEGLIPLITRLMDCPDSFIPTTITRGASEIKDVACSVLMCSTLDWFIKNTPEDMFGGGFIARMLLVYQDVSTKEQAIPKVDSADIPLQLGKELLSRRAVSGRMTFTPEAEATYTAWYSKNKDEVEHPAYEILASYLKRKPIHCIRLAMILHLVQHGTQEICIPCFHTALALLEWNEVALPPLLQELFKTSSGHDQKFILDQILHAGGVITHAALVRNVQHKMTASALRAILSSLREAKQVEEITNSLQHSWRIL